MRGRARQCMALSLGVLMAACGVWPQQSRGSLSVRSASLVVLGGMPRLDIGVDCRLSGPMQDALEHGIPITLRFQMRAGSWMRPFADATQRVELRYFPLSRRYQLRETGRDEVRSFATPAYLIDALGSLRLELPNAFAELPATTPMRVSVRIDPSTLPGALRLPALFEPAWQLAARDYAWTVAAH